jgi:hypothetical protein
MSGGEEKNRASSYVDFKTKIIILMNRFWTDVVL